MANQKLDVNDPEFVDKISLFDNYRFIKFLLIHLKFSIRGKKLRTFRCISKGVLVRCGHQSSISKFALESW